MQTFASQLKNVVTNNRNEIPNEKWFLRGKLKQILDEHQQDMSNLQFELFQEQFYSELKEQIIEDQGINPSNFLNSEILRVEIQKRIQGQGEASEVLVEKVREQVADVIDHLLQQVFGQFKDLAHQL